MNNQHTTTYCQPYQSLKCMLFGGYTPPEVPGRVHRTDDPLNKYEIAAKTRKQRVMPSPKRDALLKCLAGAEWLTVAQIAEKSNSTTHYVQKQLARLMNEGQMERRKIEQSRTVRWFEYRLVSNKTKK
jgi:hypothetical protein